MKVKAHRRTELCLAEEADESTQGENGHANDATDRKDQDAEGQVARFDRERQILDKEQIHRAAVSFGACTFDSQ